MNLTTISNEELTGRLEKLAHSERKITHLVLIHINEMESVVYMQNWDLILCFDT